MVAWFGWVGTRVALPAVEVGAGAGSLGRGCAQGQIDAQTMIPLEGSLSIIPPRIKAAFWVVQTIQITEAPLLQGLQLGMLGWAEMNPASPGCWVVDIPLVRSNIEITQ